MTKTLILFASIDGQTHKICRHIEASLNDNHHEITLLDIHHTANLDVALFDKVVIGGSVRYGKHSKQMQRFLIQNRAQLDQVKTAIFSVNATARKAHKRTPETNPYLTTLLTKAEINPTLKAVFAGKIHLKLYGPLDRFMIKLIFRLSGEKLTSDEHEFTNWQEVEAFAQRIRAL